MALRYVRRFVFLLCAVLLTLPAPGQSGDARAEKAPPVVIDAKSPDDLDLIDVGTVKEIKTSDIVVLDNGKTYHMDQIRIPVFYDPTAMSYLRTNVLNKKIGIYAVKGAKIGAADRYGNLYAHVLREDGTWIQADMVARGLAWAFSTETNHILVLPLYKYESAARADKIGFWKDADYVIKTGPNIERYINSFQIYQGVITGRSILGDRYILLCDGTRNKPGAFGFMIKFDKAPPFGQPGVRPLNVVNSWKGALVRVRGWVEKDPTSSSGMPTIEVTHPQQMEFLNPLTGEPTTKYE